MVDVFGNLTFDREEYKVPTPEVVEQRLFPKGNWARKGH